MRLGRRLYSKLVNRFFRQYRQPLPVVTSIEDVTAVLRQIRWTPDKFGDWVQWPELTWGWKKGDCEDIAKLAQALLRAIGIEGYLLSVVLSPMKYSHAVCVFGEGWFSNYNLIQDDCPSYAEIVTKIQGKNKLICWGLEDSSGKVVKIK